MEGQKRKLCRPCNPGLTDEELAAGGRGKVGFSDTDTDTSGKSGGYGSSDDMDGLGRSSKFGRGPDSGGESLFDEDSELGKMLNKCCDFLLDIYHDKYKWEVATRVAMFLTAIKLANECFGLVLPVTDYTPFGD